MIMQTTQNIYGRTDLEVDLMYSYAQMTSKQRDLYDRLGFNNRCTIMNAGNDPNGNPRRVWVIAAEDGQAIFAYDEGYLGRDCVPGSIRRAFDYATRCDCTYSQYRMLLKLPHPDYLPEQY